MTKEALHTVSDIKEYFRNDDSVYYFVSATNFNLMAMADWVSHWFDVNFIDCYDNNNQAVVLPEYTETPAFSDIEGINQFLLGNKKVVDHIKSNAKPNRPVKVLFLFYDRALEKLVQSLDMQLIMPPNTLVKHIDNKIITTEIGNSVDVPSVPNALVSIGSYSELCEVREAHGLGDDVVIQTAYGDSGKTTFFITSEEDYELYAEKIEAEDKVKVMKKIECLQVAMEACATRNGTYIGPILTEVIGHPKLTPYRGGWCGNDVNPELFTPDVKATMYRYTENIGNALYEMDYRGYFEVDYLIDIADEHAAEVYLGEINPRVTGISAITNMSYFCSQNIPLFLFHLLEFSNTEFDLQPAVFNRSVQEFSHPEFGQLIFKYTEDDFKIINSVPQTGVYSFANGRLAFVRYQNNPSELSENEIFILRIMSKGEYVYKGADILILFVNYQLQDGHNILTSRADDLIAGVYDVMIYRDLTDEEVQISQRYGKQASFKSSENTQ